MELPLDLREAVERAISGERPDRLKKVSQEITRKYKSESGQGRSLVSEDLDASVYSAVRLPATFGAVADALSYVLEFYHEPVKTVFDVGAGSGAASWAVDEILEPEKILCFEREDAMRKAGMTLMESRESLSEKANWIEMDLVRDDFATARADLVVSSYVLNEIAPKDREAVFQKLWDATDGVLLVVEPGTKEGFAVVAQLREYLLGKGAHLAPADPATPGAATDPAATGESTAAGPPGAKPHLIAPCQHDGPCRLDKDDWCHFTCRVQRSKLHKQLKDADVPYEDEKYSYIAFSRTPCEERAEARVLRHPYITKGQIDLRICAADAIREKTIRKRDGELFKRAKKCKQGDSLHF